MIFCTRKIKNKGKILGILGVNIGGSFGSTEAEWQQISKTAAERIVLRVRFHSEPFLWHILKSGLKHCGDMAVDSACTPCLS